MAQSRRIAQGWTNPSVIHCTQVWDLRQVPNRGAVPGAGLMETSLRRRRGNDVGSVLGDSLGTGVDPLQLRSFQHDVLKLKTPLGATASKGYSSLNSSAANTLQS